MSIEKPIMVYNGEVYLDIDYLMINADEEFKKWLLRQKAAALQKQLRKIIYKKK